MYVGVLAVVRDWRLAYTQSNHQNLAPTSVSKINLYSVSEAVSMNPEIVYVSLIPRIKRPSMGHSYSEALSSTIMLC